MIGETKFHATARFENSKATLKVTAVVAYGNRVVSVSEDLDIDTIDARLATIRAQRKRVPKEIAELQAALDKGKLQDEELTQTQVGLGGLVKTLTRLEAEESHQENLKEVFTKVSPKLETIFASVIKAVTGDLTQKAYAEAARAVTAAYDNGEKLDGEPTIVRLNQKGEAITVPMETKEKE
jgi:hypothetical protein